MTSIYLYCLADPARGPVLKRMIGEGCGGVDERYPVRAVERDGLAAVIGEVDPGDFHEQNLQSLEWLVPRACRHEAVVQAVMSSSPVLPCRFGTLFDSLDNLLRVLTRHRETVTAFLDKLQDKAEWNVKGYLSEAQACTRIAATDPGIVARASAMASSPGIRYLQQKQVDVQVEAALRTWIERQTRELGETLRAHAVEVSASRLLSGEATGRSERMIFNSGFLISNGAMPAFRAMFGGLQEATRQAGLTLELKGPWPPYSFCPDLTDAVD